MQCLSFPWERSVKLCGTQVVVILSFKCLSCPWEKVLGKFKLFQGRNREMAQALDYYNGQIEALMRAMSVAKIIREDKNPCMIEEGLYLGSLGAANNKVALKSLNLTHILTIARDINPPYPNEFVYKVLSVHDRVDVNISHYFEECFDFIEEAKGQGGGVLVHCFAGKSRSVTMVIAYLMKKHGMSHSEAFELVKSKRPVVSPNAGFMTQLENYDKTLKDLNTPNVML